MQQAEEGTPPLTHLAAAGGCVPGFGNLRTCGREHHLWCLPPPCTPLLLGQSRPRDKPQANILYLPGRVCKTSLWAATELTNFPRSSSCFSPGYGTGQQPARQAARSPPPRPCPRPAAPWLTRHSATCCRLRPCFARMGCNASCSCLVGLAEIRTTRCSAASSSLHGTLWLRGGREPTPPLPQPTPVSPRRGRSLHGGGRPAYGWGPRLGGEGSAKGGTCREEQQLEHDPHPTQVWRARHSLEGDSVLQPHFLVRQHSAVLIQDQGLLQMPGRV